ncbi:MAG: RlpA-like double-psi beta-barrel domain-containing protein [Synechococcaceae cyanobacterium]|nr:RlpA-like double-psi beta-barrel domain-containing protein [Synechococcaceae cyanobacterium]
MAQELPRNQIEPVAQPVDSFIRPGQIQVAAPASPFAIPGVSQINVIGQGNGGNVAGVNAFAQLAEALAPFNANLTRLVDAGLARYARAEYDRGQNEAMRAQVLANQQMLQSMGQYADETRRLAQSDPIGALMMDRVNPYRSAGRVNALSRIAAREIQSAVLARYRSTPGVEEWQPGDARLRQLQAQAVDEVTQKYRLDPSSPGFIDYVLPEIGQAGDKLTAQHWEDRQEYLKATVPRTAVVEFLGIYNNALQTGVVEWQEFDSVSGRAISRTATRKDAQAWEYGLRMLGAQVADRMATESGMPGMATRFKEQFVRELFGQAAWGQNDELRRIVAGIEIGPPGKDGRRPLAAEMFGTELADQQIRYGQAAWQEQQRRQAQGIQAFQSELATITFSMPDGPARGQAIQELVQRYEAQGLPRFELLKAAEEASGVGDRIAARSYSTDGIEQFFLDVEQRVGAAWDAAAADQEYRRLRATVAPQDRGRFDRQWASIREGKEREADDVPSQLVDPLINRAINSRIKEYYPGNTTEAALRGADITRVLAYGDANIAESQRRQLSAYRRHVYNRLAEATARKGSQLTPAEITSTTEEALREYGSKDAKALADLFPGSARSNVPAVPGGRPGQPGPGDKVEPPPGRQPFTLPVYPSGQLDNIPNRRERLRSEAPVMELESAERESLRVLNGQPPSAAVTRAARDAGLPVGRFLLRQLQAYPSFRIPPAAERELLRTSSGAQGISDAARQTALAPPRPVQSIASFFFNAITGTAPAMAGTLPPLQGGGRNGSGPFSGSQGGFVNPVPGVNFRANRGGYDADTGLDIHGPEGSDVVAAFPGRIVYAERGHSAQMGQSSSSRGYRDQHSVLVELDQPFTFNGKTIRFAWYSHLQGLDPAIAGRNGLRIRAGQRLGAMGIANRVSHLHFGLVGDRAQRVYLTHREIRDLFSQGGGSRSLATTSRPPTTSTLTTPTTRRGGGMTGLATYYTGSGGSDGVAGGPTANGERYDPSRMTAAVQWSLRDRYLNKWVRVEDLDTGRSVRVWVNDVGQMGGTRTSVSRADPRVVDLSPAAFRRLFGSTRRGVGRIRIVED